MMSKGNSRADGISDRESTNQPDCEDHQDIGHTLANPKRPNRGGGGVEDCPPNRVPTFPDSNRDQNCWNKFDLRQRLVLTGVDYIAVVPRRLWLMRESHPRLRKIARPQGALRLPLGPAR
jgi:hypothetical protein